MKMSTKELGQALKDITVKTATGNNEAVAADGGNAVGSVITDQVFNTLDAYKGTFIHDVRIARVTRGPIVKLRSRVNTLSSEPSSGIRTYWVSEAAQSDASKFKFLGQSCELGKLVCRVPATMELVEDVEELGQMFKEDATISMGYKVESEILMGTGAIKGVLTDGDGATISVAVTGTVPTEDELIDFVEALHPMATGASWYVSKTVYSGIIKIDYTTPNAITFEDGQYYIFGYPVVQCPQMATVPYNIVLGDFSAYSIAYIDPKFDKSDAVRYLEDEREYRMQMRVAGNAIAERTTLDDGIEYGWFVANSLAEANQSSSSESSVSSVSSVSSASTKSSASSLSTESSASTASSVSSQSPSSGSSASSGSSESPSESSGSSASGI
jgi:HK97 family phage major capsid protein